MAGAAPTSSTVRSVLTTWPAGTSRDGPTDHVVFFAADHAEPTSLLISVESGATLIPFHIVYLP